MSVFFSANGANARERLRKLEVENSHILGLVTNDSFSLGSMKSLYSQIDELLTGEVTALADFRMVLKLRCLVVKHRTYVGNVATRCA